MRVLVLGGGGREHALVWKLSRSPQISRLIAAPGNAGMAEEPGVETQPLVIEDPDAVVACATAEAVDLVVVGPEAPLAAGVADALTAAGVACFGPSAAAARLETSKSFTKEICRAVGAPTAAGETFRDAAAAEAYLERLGAPVVVKADGLAAGKGVVVAETLAEARAAVRDMLGGRFGAASEEVLIEEFLRGEEASLFALCDGAELRVFGSAQDHKRAFDGDQGPNTGGMGAYAPAPILTPAVEARAMDEILRPIAAEMARRGTPYRGVLYAGLMIDAGRPRLVEINARFGDPETQALMLRLSSDLLPLLHATARGALATAPPLAWREEAAITITLATRGYPGAYEKGSEIHGLAAAAAVPGATVHHAGTRREPGAAGAGPRLLANGGRVLNVSALGATLAEARARAYQAVDAIEWPEGFHRRDIGWRAL